MLMLVVAAMATIGCQSDGDVEANDNNSMAIRLWADMGYTPGLITTPSSRGNASSTSGIIDPATDTVLTMGMARIDEVYTPSYPAFLSCGEPIIAEMGAPNPDNSYIRSIDFKSAAQFYYNKTDNVKYVAWQPWQPEKEGYEYASNDTATTVRIPVTGDSDILYANATTGSQSEGFELMKFNHALCIYRIYVYSMQEEDVNQSSAWGSIEDLVIEDLPTSCVMTLPTDSEGAFNVAYEGKETLNLSDPNNNIFFSPGDKIPVGLANRRMVAKCVAAPPTDNILHISLATSGVQARQRVSIARDFNAGYAYDIVLRFSNHGMINAEVSVGEWRHHDEVIEQEVSVDMFYNLSNNETANSYIVNSSNYGYCFDATVKGNGDSSLVGNVDTSLNPGYVDILWDDTPMITINGEQRKALTLDTNTLSEGKVLFHVQGNPDDKEDHRLLSEGNVVIAAYDKKGGNILWTWHIWITDRVKAQGYPHGYIVQDRNLGATASAPESGGSMDGLYYQWGRPTPFKPASSGVYGAVSTVPSSTSQVATVEEAISQPTTLYGSGNAVNYDWLATKNNALWGYQNEHTDLEKTIYDPCPPGYMVGDARVWQNIATYEKSGGWHSGSGVNLNIASHDVWYPFQGYIESDGTENITRNISRLWSSVVDLRTSGTTPPYELQYTSSKNASLNSTDSRRNRALPVRCVSDHSTAIVTNLSASQTANCYMVHRAGYYKFKATVRGNGVGELLPFGGTTTWDITDGMSANIKPAKVDFLWWQGDLEQVQSTVQTENRADIDLIPMQIMNNGEPDSDGYVHFYVGEFRKGNVGLVAYDVDGEILWSWHIWFTDKPVDKLTGNYTTMDRYLGATSVPTIGANSLSFNSNNHRLATYGFYYQWGKKDPYFGPPAHNSGSETVSNNRPKCSRYWVKAYNGGWSSRTDFDTSTQVRVPAAVQNPMRFYKGTAVKDSGSSWVDPAWVDGAVNVALWGYAVVTYEEGQVFSKTIHDPCPPGYQTMFNQAWSYGADNAQGYAPTSAGAINYSNGEQNFDSMGIVFNKNGFDKAWYPFVGQRDGQTGGYTRVGTNGYAVTGMPYKAWNIRSFYYESGRSGQNNGAYGSSYAMPVRCQKQ